MEIKKPRDEGRGPRWCLKGGKLSWGVGDKKTIVGKKRRGGEPLGKGIGKSAGPDQRR